MKKALICLFFVLMCASVQAKTTHLGTFRYWTAYKIEEKGSTVCYMVSVPTKSEGKYKQRGDVFLMITHRPKDQTFDTVSFTAGYTYKKNSDASVKVDNNANISLFTHQDTAWTNKVSWDKKLVEQMKNGEHAVFRGKSLRGTLTTDTFSLIGFTKAYNAINQACGRK